MVPLREDCKSVLCTKVFNFHEVELACLLSVPSVSFPEITAKSNVLNFLLYVFFKEFYVVNLMFRSVIHFELIFIHGVR